MKLKPYPKTKPSGVQWLGDVPEHWDELPLKCKLLLRNGGTPSSSEDSYWEGEVSWFTPEDLGKNKSKAIGKSRRTLTQEGLANCGADLAPKNSVIVSTRAPIGHVAVSEVRACCNQGARILSPRDPGTSSDFVYYSIVAFREVLQSAGKGTTFLELPAGALGAQRIAWPTPTEQTAIAAYLDRETGRIDELVGKKRDLIERLKEKRTALISRTVTRGLPADLPPATLAKLEALAGQKLPLNPPLKPSGIQWLGAIPENWNRTTVKRVVSVRGRIGFRGYTTDDLVSEGEGALALGGANLTKSGRLDLSKRTYLSWFKYEESPEIKVETGDLIIGQRGTCGDVVLIDRDLGPTTINPSLVLLKQPVIHCSYLCYWLMGRFVRGIFDTYLSATAVPMLSQEQIGNVPVCHPSFPEQRAIVAYLDEETAKLDALVAKVETAIERLQEYRTALITAAVTGKIDVTGQDNQHESKQ